MVLKQQCNGRLCVVLPSGKSLSVSNDKPVLQAGIGKVHTTRQQVGPDLCPEQDETAMLIHFGWS